jgi:MFS family permease
VTPAQSGASSAPIVPRTPLAHTWPLFLGMGILMLGSGLQGTLLGVRATLEGFPTAVTGLVMSSYYIGYLSGTQIAPRALRQVGHVRVFAALAALASVAVLVLASWVHPLPWAAMRLLSGVCFAGIYVVAESWLNHHATRSNRGRLLALYMLVLYVGLGGGQYLLVLSNPSSQSPFMLVSGLISLAMVPILASAQHTPEPAAPQRVRYRDLYRNSPLGLVAVTVSGMISSIIFSMGPVYARLTGADTHGVAAFMAASILAAVLTQYPVGRLSDLTDRRTLIAAACLIATIAGGVASFWTLPHALLLAMAALFSGSALTLYSLAVSHVNDHLRPAQMVGASSRLLLVNGMAAAVGPTLVGAAMAVYGPSAYFGTLATLTATLSIYNLWRMTRRPPVPREQKSPFINTQQIVSNAGLDPPPETDPAGVRARAAAPSSP